MWKLRWLVRGNALFRATFLWFGVIGLTATWLGCGTETSREEHRASTSVAAPEMLNRSLDLRSIRFGTAGSHLRDQLQELGLNRRKGILPKDNIYLEAAVFHDELQTREAIFLDRAYELEFLPLVVGEDRLGTVIEASLVMNGTRHHLINAEAIASRAPDLVGERRLAALGQVVRIDLSAYQGQQVRLRWAVGTSRGPVARAAVAMPRLRPRETDSGQPPHVLMICIDALRYDYSLGEYAAELMPGLQALRAEATTYTRAASNASWTLPSITSVLSGLYPRYHKTGKLVASGKPEQWPAGQKAPRGQFEATFAGQYHLFSLYPSALDSLSEELARAGYRSGMVVSNFFYVHSGLAKDGTDLLYDTGTVPGNFVNRAAEQVVQVLGTESPLFLLVHYMDVHGHGGWYDESAGDTTAGYRTGTRKADQYLAELLTEWRRVVGFDNSLIIVFSDHGEHLGETGLRGHGNSMHEVLLRVPLVIKYPREHGQAGQIDARLVSLVDLYPTVLDVAGVSRQGSALNGVSLLEHTATNRAPTRTVFSDYQLYGDERSAVRDRTHKLILDLDRRQQRLISLSGVIAHEREATTDDPESRQALEEAFRSYLEQSGAAAGKLWSDEVVADEELQEGLRALGYIE